jgi:3-(methylthio)propionyl---CoA ligase
MDGMMMHRPLLVKEILEYGIGAHRRSEIISQRTEGDIHRYTYPEAGKRIAQLAHALTAHGVEMGDRVATLAWNGYRHFELYYAISCMGAVCHTINPRLAAEQLIYIVNHAEDKLIFLDTTFVPVIAAVQDQLPADVTYVIMTDRAHMPETPFPALCYEALIEGQPEQFAWPDFHEDTACSLCYTSGTTGNPKGTLYSHRSTVLHAMISALMLNGSFGEGKKVLPVVPLFHVNAWGLPYSALLAGVSLVMPGAALDGPSLFRLMDAEAVHSAWGVPTVWMGLLAEIRAQGRKPEGFVEVVIGGSAAPKSMIEAFERMGTTVSHAWGMTEMSPVGTHGALPFWMNTLPFEDKLAQKAKQGRRCFGVDLKIVDETGARLPHDGKAVGELFVRGNTVAAGYFRNEEASAKALDAEGWFGTGDVASICPEGFLTVQDRAKDLIKSGGEWISSIDLENACLSHPGIANCAAIGVAHPRWDERPVLVAVASGEARPSLDEINAHIAEHFAKWQLPDDVIWVDALPMTATGKVSKLKLRQQLGEYKHPELREAV